MVKILRNWARAKARNADKRGRLDGSKDVGEDADGVVCVAALTSAIVTTSSMYRRNQATSLPLVRPSSTPANSDELQK